MVNFGPLTAEIYLPVWAPQQISTGFASWQRYCTNVAQLRPTKLWPSPWLIHYIYIFGAFCPKGNFARYKIHFAFKSCILLYWQRYCRALEQRASVKFAACYKEWNYAQRRNVSASPIFGWAAITLGIGPHSSFFTLFDSRLILMLLYDSLNLVINAFSLGLLWAMVQEKESR